MIGLQDNNHVIENKYDMLADYYWFLFVLFCLFFDIKLLMQELVRMDKFLCLNMGGSVNQPVLNCPNTFTNDKRSELSLKFHVLLK